MATRREIKETEKDDGKEVNHPPFPPVFLCLASPLASLSFSLSTYYTDKNLVTERPRTRTFHQAADSQGSKADSTRAGGPIPASTKEPGREG